VDSFYHQKGSFFELQPDSDNLFNSPEPHFGVANEDCMKNEQVNDQRKLSLPVEQTFHQQSPIAATPHFTNDIKDDAFAGAHDLTMDNIGS